MSDLQPNSEPTEQNTAPPPPEVEELEGIVCICDALGARSFSIARSREVLRKMGLLVDTVTKIEALMHDTVTRARIDTEYSGLNVADAKIFTFGDTLLYAWPIDSESQWTQSVSRFSLWANALVLTSLALELPIRGCFTYGKYLVKEDRNIVLGPAVTDAAGWYDRAKWIGMHSTPHMKIMMESRIESDKDKWLDHLVSYDVPLSTGIMKLWCPRWPDNSATDPPPNDKSGILRTLSKLHFSPKDADKYMNTLAFIEHVFAEHEE